jgi:hypothetical protein
MSRPRPEVRGRHMQVFHEAVEKERRAARILARVMPETLQQIQETASSAWLPVAVNLELTKAVWEELGENGSRTFFPSMTLSEYDSPIFRPFIASAKRLLGLNPGSYAKMLPTAYALIFRNCGRLELLERRGGLARVLQEEIPIVLCRDEIWLEATRFGFHSAFDLTRTPGRVEWDELNLRLGRAVYRFEWNE